MANVNECGIAAKQSATCTQKCKTCQREGIPILPLRYAVIPKDKAKGRILMGAAVTGGGKSISAPLGEGIKNKALKNHAYSLRILRQGFLYVFLENTKVWQAYGIKLDGLLSQFPDIYNPPADAQKEMSFSCYEAGDNVPAAFINVPNIDKTPKVWIAYSSIPWEKAVFDNFAAKESLRKERMTLVDLVAFKAAPTTQNHVFEIDEGLNTLVNWVEEYTPTFDVAYKRQGWMLTPAEQKAEPALAAWVKANFKTPIWSTHGFRNRTNSLAPTSQFVKKAKEKHGLPIAAVALHDTAGIIEELNHSRQKVLLADLQWQNEKLSFEDPHDSSKKRLYTRAHMKMSADAIKQMREYLVQQAIATTLAKSTPNQGATLDKVDLGKPRSMSEAEYYRKMADGSIPRTSTFTESKIQDSSSTKSIPQVTRSKTGIVHDNVKETALEDFEDTLEQFDEQYNAQACATFVKEYEATIKQHQATLKSFDADYIAWLNQTSDKDGVKALSFLCTHDTKKTKDPNWLYSVLVANCVGGGGLTEVSSSWFQKTLQLAPSDPEQILLRSLVGNGTTFVASLGQDNLSKVYDTVKTLQGSEEYEKSAKFIAARMGPLLAPIVKAVTNTTVSLAGKLTSDKKRTVDAAVATAVALIEKKFARKLLAEGIRLDDYMAALDSAEMAQARAKLDSPTTTEGGTRSRQRSRNKVTRHGDTRFNVTVWTLDNQKLAVDVNLTPEARYTGAGISVAIMDATNQTPIQTLTLAPNRVRQYMGTSLKNSWEFTKSPSSLLAVGALYFQITSLMQNAEAAGKATSDQAVMANAALFGAGMSLVGGGVEISGLIAGKAMGNVGIGLKLGKVAGFIGGGCAIYDGIITISKGIQQFNQKDKEAGTYNIIGGVTLFASGITSIIAVAVGSGAIFGPVGIALALGIAGCYLLYKAGKAEPSDAAKWVARNPFWPQKTRDEPVFIDWPQEEAALVAIFYGVKAELRFNKDEVAISSTMGIGSVAEFPASVSMSFMIANFDSKTQGWRYRLFVKLSSGGREVEVYHWHHPQAPVFPPSGLVSASTIPAIHRKSGKYQIKNGGLVITHHLEGEFRTLASARLECEFFQDLSDTSNPSRIELRADAQDEVVAS